MENNKGYIIQFDGLRFYAIFMVMIAHWLQWQLNNPVINGFPFAQGVTLFFVLSGYLITDILIRNKLKYEGVNRSKKQLIYSFYGRRFLRIFPIYYLTLFVLLALNYPKTRELFPWLVSYSSNIYQSIHCTFVGDFNHFWSLAVEEQFYLFWPWLIVFTPNRYIGKTILATILFSVVTKTYIFFAYPGNWMASSYFTFSCMNALGFGALFAYWNIFKPNWAQWFRNNLLIIGFVIGYFVLNYYFRIKNIFIGNEVFNEVLFALMSVLIINQAAKNGFKGIMKFLLENRFVVYCGKISYGMYVYHLFMPSLFWYLRGKLGFGPGDKYIQFIAFFLLTFLLSYISWKIIEYPISKLKNRLAYFSKD